MKNLAFKHFYILTLFCAAVFHILGFSVKKGLIYFFAKTLKLLKDFS